MNPICRKHVLISCDTELCSSHNYTQPMYAYFIFVLSACICADTRNLTAGAFLMFNHPSTVENCLCFDDAIACLSTILGTTIARWSSATLMFPARLSPSRSWLSAVHWATYLTIPAKIVITFSCLALWRAMTKTFLPNFLESIHPSPVLARRPEPDSYAKKLNGMHSTSASSVDPSVMNSSPPLLRRGFSSSCVPQPSEQNGSNAEVPGTPMNISPFSANQGIVWPPDSFQSSFDLTSFHGDYFVIVIVKTVVYFGIGWLGSEMLPAFFERLGWS
jgi:dihydrosphingosine 1-phosphate phosphatase